MATHVNKRTFFQRSVSLFMPFWKPILEISFLSIVGQAVATFSPFLFGKAVDAVAFGNVRMTFIFLALSFVLAAFSNIVLSFVREKIELEKLDYHIGEYFSIYSLRKLFGFSVGQHINEHSGVRQGVVNKGQGSLVSLLHTVLYGIFPGIIRTLVTLVILAFFDWRVAIIASIFVLLYIVISYHKNQKFFLTANQLRKANQDRSKLQSELYRNTTLVISEAQEESTIKEFTRESEKVTRFEIVEWLRYNKGLFSGRFWFLTVGQYMSLALGVYLILIGQHSAGMFVTLFSWTSTIFGSLEMAMLYQRNSLYQIAEIKKYFELLDIVPDIDPNVGGKTIPDLKGKIEFKNVSFAYPYRYSKQEEEEEKIDDKKSDHAIAGVSLMIPAGSKVGFVGVSGSGKSTIVNLLRRFYDPTSGTILVDGEDLKELDLRWLRSRIGNVEQKIELFDRSIRDNILFGLPEDKREIGDEALQKAVEDASLTDFVAKLKDHGLDTLIGENGIKVSGGERQRIGIARALIKNPKILIFDEATSALDSINEKLIHDAINRGAKGRTTIIIAHRLSTVMDADIIFVVANGKIVDNGKHEELIKRCQEYQDLVKNQVLAG